eukprot:9503180-Alexandrium_andersonii.AAC.1
MDAMADADTTMNATMSRAEPKSRAQAHWARDESEKLRLIWRFVLTGAQRSAGSRSSCMARLKAVVRSSPGFTSGRSSRSRSPLGSGGSSGPMIAYPISDDDSNPKTPP